MTMDPAALQAQVKENGFLVAVDIGTGLGAKLGLFTDAHHQFDEFTLPVADFAQEGDRLSRQLVNCIEQRVAAKALKMDQALAIGIASPGLFRGDGSFRLVANLPFLNDFNLPQAMSSLTGLPAGIENDANAGGLAEWSALRVDLIYWVFGGGWGGAWINRHGEVMYPALDWDGRDEHLHPTNEPGYAIGLDKWTLRAKFYEMGCSFDRFERILCEDLQISGKATGPGGSPDHLRAEMILSGPGRCRLFRAMVGDDDFYERFLDIHESSQMSDPTVAGAHISKLSQMRVEAAVKTDRLFGHILAQATHVMIRQARRDGLPEGVPICLGGKPSYALPYFGPSAQGRLGAMGIMSYLRPSVIDERGFNANLVGAAVLADKVRRAGR